MILTCRKALDSNLIRGGAVTGLSDFLSAYDECSKLFGEMENGRFLRQVLLQFGILGMYIERDKKENSKVNKRTDNIEQLVNMLSMEQFSNGQEGINNFLELASLDSSSLGDQEGKSEDGVTLITMHNTKGLEYDRVFMVGMEDEIFPGRRDDNTQEDIEEERRICYVAMTRARYELYMFSASSRLRWGSVQRESPSMFLNEIDPSHMEEIDNRFKAKLGAKFRFDERYNDDYKSGYGNGFGNTYTSKFGGYGSSSGSKGKYSSNYVNTDNAYKSSYDDDFGPGTRHQGPKPSAASKYNIRNNANAVYRSGTAQDSKPSAILVKKADGQDAPVPGTITYEVGDRIRSEFYGEGQITGKRNFAGREVLDVKFDSGRTGTFASDKVAFEKI